MMDCVLYNFLYTFNEFRGKEMSNRQNLVHIQLEVSEGPLSYSAKWRDPASFGFNGWGATQTGLLELTRLISSWDGLNEGCDSRRWNGHTAG